MIELMSNSFISRMFHPKHLFALMFFQAKVLAASASIPQNIPEIEGFNFQSCPKSLFTSRVQTNPGQPMKINVQTSICTTKLTITSSPKIRQLIPSETPENPFKQRTWETLSFEKGTVSPKNVGLAFV